MATIWIKLPPHPDVVRAMMKQALQAAAVQAVSIIRIRSARGIDADGRPFKPYSPAYAVMKAATGRNVSPVDLTLTGQMLGNLKVKSVTPSRATIGFEGVHRSSSIERVARAWAQLHGPRKAGRLIGANGRFATEWVQVGRGRKLRNGQFASRTLKRSAKTTSMAAVVIGNDRIRPFFHLRSAADLQAVTRAAQARLDELIRAENAKKA